MVVLTITCDEKLRAQLPSWLLVSLAMADLLVGLLVMPLTMVYEIIGEWTFGKSPKKRSIYRMVKGRIV